MAKGESRQRSEWDADSVTAVLRSNGLAALQQAEALRLVMDGSPVRRAGARAQEGLMRLKALDGGFVNGYRRLNGLGLGSGARAVLSQRLFSSQQAGFQSESLEVLTAIRQVEQRLADFAGPKTWVLDRGFDNDEVWWAMWGQPGSHLLSRVYHLERVVLWQSSAGEWQERYLAATLKHLRALVRLETDLEVRLLSQARAKRQSVTVEVSSVPIRVYHPSDKGQSKAVWLVKVQVLNAHSEPWYLLTDWPVNDAASARQVFILYRHRWSVDETFKFVKGCFGLEEVQMLSFEAVRTLVAFAWVAAGFLVELGLRLDAAQIRVLARLGGWEERPNRPPGKLMLTRGLRRLLDKLAAESILQDYLHQYGDLPPFVKRLLATASSNSFQL